MVEALVVGRGYGCRGEPQRGSVVHSRGTEETEVQSQVSVDKPLDGVVHPVTGNPPQDQERSSRSVWAVNGEYPLW